MNQVIDVSTLTWIKKELDETLQDARRLLEAYIEDRGDDSQLGELADNLHQVFRTLQMVELYGASLLAEEMEQLVRGLISKQVTQFEDACEILMRAILQLPDYLDRLIAGHSDIPLVLLSILNDLRAVRGETLISENAMFSPDLTAPLPESMLSRPLNGELNDEVRALRHRFQLALLSVIRDKDIAQAIGSLGEIMDRLLELTSDHQVARLWWITSAVMDGLADETLESGFAVKRLLGEVDRTIKQIIDDGIEVFSAENKDELLTNLLFYVGQSNSDSARINEIRNTYKLNELLPSSEELVAARESLSGHNTELFENVAVAVQEELVRLKGDLDGALQTGTVEALNPVIVSLKSLGDTLGMLGLGAARARVLEEVPGIQDYISSGEIPPEIVLMNVASTLLYVESSVEHMGNGSVASDSRNVDQTLSDNEFDEVMDVVLQEALMDLSRAKEAIVSYIDSENSLDELATVPQWFNQIKGGLQLLGEQRAAAAMNAVAHYVNEQLIQQKRQLEQKELDTLADSICGLEYYLEGRREQRIYAGSAMQVAEDRLEQLGYPVEKTESSENSSPDEVDDIESLEMELETVNDEVYAAAEFELLDGLLDDEEILQDNEQEIVPELVEEYDVSVALMDAETLSGEESFEDDDLAVIDDDMDEEILEIFIEEVDEEIASIQQQQPIWLQNTENHEPLESIRRSYHTLKGSGRMVGAMRIGEFAWCFENMLNRVIDGTIEVDSVMTGLLEQGVEALPALVEQIKQGTPVQQSVQQIMLMADALIKGEKAQAITEVASEEAAPNDSLSVADEAEFDESTEAVVEPFIDLHDIVLPFDENDSVEPEAIMDAALYEIFDAETRVHLAEIYSFIDRSEIDVTKIDEPLIRALHTLRGSAQMAEVTEMARLSAELGHLVQILMLSEQAVSTGHCELLAESVCLFEEILTGLPEKIVVPESLDSVVSKAQALSALAEAAHDPVVPEYSEEDLVSAADPYEDCDDELLGIFLEEAVDNLVSASDALARYSESNEDIDAMHELERAIHTLKGGARMSDLPEIGDVAHAVEALAEAIVQGRTGFDDRTMAGFHRAHDVLSSMVKDVLDRTALYIDQELLAELQWLREQAPASLPADEAVCEEHVEENVTSAIEVESDPDPEDVCDDIVAEEVVVPPAVDVVDDELLEVFLEEAGDILENTEQILLSWKADLQDLSVVPAFQRELHTLKGGARMADVSAIGDLAHGVESLMVAIYEDSLAPDSSLMGVLEQVQERLGLMVGQVSRRQSVAAADDLLGMLEVLRAGGTVSVNEIIMPVVQEENEEKSERRHPDRERQTLVRVRADLLDNLVNYAGEISIYRSRLEQQVGSLHFNLMEMDQTVSRLRNQLRKLEMETEAQILFRYEKESDAEKADFDPLEMDRFSRLQQLSRSLVESVSDVSSIQDLLESTTKESETLLLQQSRINTELQEGLMRTRMVPFLGLGARMRRIVKQTCQELGKKAELELHGADGEMDRTVIDRIIAPLEHMLRNAISHGIESPDRRAAAGKPESGTIRITLERESSEFVLRITDDGAGINIEAIRNKAIERGLMTADSDLNDDGVLQFILETGFSTAEKVSQVAGRGVGMDVVNSEVKQLGGSLHIDSKLDRGSVFTVRLPFTLAVNQALLVEVGKDTYAIPLSDVEGIVRMRNGELAKYFEGEDTTPQFEYSDKHYDVKCLSSMLGEHSLQFDDAQKHVPVLLVRSSTQRVALQVDKIIASREIVVKSVGAQISTVHGISGATILGDGRVVMILDIAALLRSGAASLSGQYDESSYELVQDETITVMVVDDSITVRKVTSRLLERHGMNVVLAKDGVDAVATLQDQIPDIMLLDIEMPRMDGFELATHIRNDARLRNIPIIMITSRTGDKHRQRAMGIGVNRYLGKPFQELELLENIQELLEDKVVCV